MSDLSPGMQLILDQIDLRGSIRVSVGWSGNRRHVFTGYGDPSCNVRSFDALMRRGLIEEVHPRPDWRWAMWVRTEQTRKEGDNGGDDE